MFLWHFLDYPTYDWCMFLSTLVHRYQSTWHIISTRLQSSSAPSQEPKISHRVEPVMTTSALQYLIYSIRHPVVTINSSLLTTYSSGKKQSFVMTQYIQSWWILGSWFCASYNYMYRYPTGCHFILLFYLK
jgi:hypothetical protein